MLNYRHLHYFWVVAREGGFVRAAERLGMAVQTVSAQVRELERELDLQLLKTAGRGVTLTEAGKVAFERADEIFQLGEGFTDAVRAVAEEPVQRLAVGLSDGLSKLAAHAVLAPVLSLPNLRLLCHEGETAQLLGELALHQLDLVLTDQPAPQNGSLRLTSQLLSDSPVDWYGPASLVNKQAIEQFPQSLARLPVLLPTAHAAMRKRLDRWFEGIDIRPRIVGEFEDSALLGLFAAGGLGVFPVSRLGGEEVARTRGLKRLGHCEQVREEIHAIRSRRGQHHPLVVRILHSK